MPLNDDDYVGALAEILIPLDDKERVAYLDKALFEVGRNMRVIATMLGHESVTKIAERTIKFNKVNEERLVNMKRTLNEIIDVYELEDIRELTV